MEVLMNDEFAQDDTLMEGLQGWRSDGAVMVQ